MTGYGPALPTTSGGIGVLGLAWGLSHHNWIIMLIAMVGIGTTVFCFARLRQGESKIHDKNG